jgi:KH domain-containing protein
MLQIYCENPKKITQNKKQIQTELKIKIQKKPNEEGVFIIDTPAENEFIANSFFEAMNLGFSVPKALTLKEENMDFTKVNIKDHTKRGDLERVRARIIGTQGKVLDTLETLTETYISLHDNSIGIIGPQENIELAATAVKRLIAGSKHTNVYASLERQKALDKQQL